MKESEFGMDALESPHSPAAVETAVGGRGATALSLTPPTGLAESARPPIRVVVVDDSALVRSILAEIINREPDMRCVGTAADPLIAREVIREVDPDVVTLDIEMPRMDGLDFLSRLMRLRPTPVVMVSTMTERGTDITVRALELGAVDFVSKPRLGISNGLQAMGQEITEKIRTASRARVRRLTVSPTQPPPPLQPLAEARAPASARRTVKNAPATKLASLGGLGTEKLIFIGASTGGTEATRELLQHLPADAPAVLVAQHMPSGFTRSYAARLDQLCPQHVVEATDGERLLPGHVYIAPGGCHLTVTRSGCNYVARVEVGLPVNRHMPSVEVLFDSATQVVGRNALGVMLTGMGADGALALRRMRDAGSFNLVQDEASCVVFGMPREAIAQGAADEVLPLNRIAPRIVEWLRTHAGVTTNRI